jgi:hypothetical protein
MMTDCRWWLPLLSNSRDMSCQGWDGWQWADAAAAEGAIWQPFSGVADVNDTIQWKSRKMIMFSINLVNEINSSNYKNKMNKKLKDEKINILITMINLFKTKNSTIFIVSEKNTAN